MNQDELFDQTVDSYNEGNRHKGMEACERILSQSWVLPNIEEAIRRNATWYLEPIALTGGSAFSEPPYHAGREITFDRPTGWGLFNPSIASDDEGRLKLIVRSSNYHIELNGRYTIHDSDGIIRTTNYIGNLEDKGGLRTRRLGGWKALDTTLVDESRRGYLVQGFEDARLFSSDGEWRFLATVRDRHPHGLCQQALCTLRGHTVCDMYLFPEVQPGRHEKNWMPISGTDASVYQVGCPTIVKDLWTGGRWWMAPPITRSFRGGAIVRYNEGRSLAIIHESVDFPEGSVPRRVYQHRFVQFDSAYKVRKISPPFCFHGRGIEFAAGMVVVDDDVIISYGVDDASAWLLRLPLERVLGMLKGPYDEDL